MPWTTSTTASDGNAYQFFRQKREMGCGPACVVTVAYHILNRKYDVNTVSEYFKAGEGVDHVTRDGIRDFVTVGSWHGGVIAALEKLKIDGIRHSTIGSITKFAGQVRTSQPAILGVGWYRQVGSQWRRDGGHWVVALKKYRNNVICLDPALVRAPSRPGQPHRAGVKGINEFSTANFADLKRFGVSLNYVVDYGDGEVTGYVDQIIRCSKASRL